MVLSVWSLAALPAAAQGAPAITSAPPPEGVVGGTYLHQFTATGFTSTPTFTVTSGQVPPGVVVDAQGHVFGVPTAAGSFGPTTVCASNGAQQACQTFTIVIKKLTPILFSQPSQGGPVGTGVRNTTSVGSQQTPTGTITFRLYSDAACTNQVFTSTNPVDAQGRAVSDDFVPTAPGTYRWSVFYSGDANHEPSEFVCSPVNTVTITGGTTTTTSSTTTLPTTTTTTSSTSTTSTTTTLPPTSTTLPPTSTTSTSTSSTVPPTSSSTSTSTSTTSSTTSTSTTSSTVPTGTTSSTTSSSTTSSTSTSTSTSSSTSTSTTSTTVLSSTSSTSSSSTSTSSPTSSTSTTSTTVPPTQATSTTATSTTVTTPPLPPGGLPIATTTTTPAGPTITTDRLEASPGDSVNIAGSGFPPGAPLAAELRSDPVQLGTTVADASGRFRMTVTVPLGTQPGLHTLRVQVVGGTQFADASLLVRAPAAVVQAATQGRVLSRTGGEFGHRARQAMAFITAGFVLVGLAWNDRRPAGRRSPWSSRRGWL